MPCPSLKSGLLPAQLAVACVALATSPARAQSILLSEVSSGGASASELLGAPRDWVELYNPTGATVDLGGYGLSDRRDDPYRYRVPAGLVIDPDQRALFVSMPYPQAPTEFSFGLRSRGETVYLTDAAGALVDSVAYPATPLGYSYARVGDTGAWGYADPSPVFANPAEVSTDIAPAVAIAADSPAAVTIATTDEGGGDVLVRYTTDGSVPVASSPLYTGPFAVDGRAVVRARAFRAGAVPGAVTARTWLPGVPTDLPVVALTVDPGAVFDSTRGIWVKGPNADALPPFNGANYYANERIAAHFELFAGSAPDGTSADAALAEGRADFADGASLRVFGNFSRQLPQKSSALGASPLYGSRDDEFGYRFFPTWPGRRGGFSGLLLRNGGNDFTGAHLRDGLVHTLARRTSAPTLAFRPVSLYVNGAYWGMQALRERPDEETVARREGVDVDDIDLVENRGAEDPLSRPPNAGTLDAYRDLIAFFDAGVPAGAAGYDALAERFDLDNFLDYYATQLYTANYDWPGNNNRLYRVRRPGARWRYLLYDLDYTFGINGSAPADDRRPLRRLLDPNGPAFPNPPQATRFFRESIANAELRRAFGNRVADLLNFDYHPDTVRSAVDSLVALVAPEAARHRARWDPRGEWLPWREHVDSLERFARVRPGVLREGLRDELGFGAETVVRLAVSGPAGANPADVGAIELNDYRTATVFPWRGTYFAGTPVSLRAHPRPGFTFVRWEGLPAGADATSEVAVVDPAALTAVATAVFAVNTAALAEVIVNEINYNSPDTLGAGDWVELYNPTDAAIDLGGFAFEDQGEGNRYDIPAGTSLPPDGYLVIARELDRFAATHPGVSAVIGPFDFGLGNGGDLVAISDETGRHVDSIRYDDEAPWPVAADGDGPTLELVPGTRDPAARDDPANWQASRPSGGTPGARNSEGASATTTPERPALRVYPSPTTGVLTVELDSAGGELIITDFLGREVRRVRVAAGETRARLSLADVAAGAYRVTHLDPEGKLIGAATVLRMGR